jgi:hypothetical protein
VARRARDLVEQYLSSRRDEVHAHIVSRLQEMTKERGEFVAVHVRDVSPAEVRDDPECRLVVLPPTAPYVNRDSSSQAMVSARAILEQRSSGARHYRNMLVFLAADQRRLEELERGVAEFLAWSDIHGRWEELGLDAFGRNQAESKKRDANQTVDLRVAETYHWALVPNQPDPTGPIECETTRTDGQGGLALRASRKLVNSGQLNVAFAPELLRGLLSEGGPLAPMWATGHVSVNELWDAFARYPYLPRLRDMDVLCITAAQGAGSITWQQHGFALAEAHNASTGRYVGLVVDALAGHVAGTTLVVRPDLAAAQQSQDAAITGVTPPGAPSPVPGQPDAAGSGAGAPSPEDNKLRRFYAVSHLDPERYQRDFAKIAQEIVANLAGNLGTEVEITVEIRAVNEAGFPENIIRTVNENASTLKLEQHGFERQ